MIESISKRLTPLKNKISKHNIYKIMTKKEHVISFMEIHIYSVWDFMNLLKFLQQHLTCISYPWTPSDNPRLSRLINEIVLEEESDLIEGQVTSHYAYYFDILNNQLNDCLHLKRFDQDIKSGVSYEDLINKDYIPLPARKFMNTTYDCINDGLLSVASSFAFGRESLVPIIFDPITKIVGKSNDEKLSKFVRYLERHILLDGDFHSNLAFEMLTILAKSKEDWQVIEKSATKAIEARLLFWNNIENYIVKKNKI